MKLQVRDVYPTKTHRINYSVVDYILDYLRSDGIEPDDMTREVIDRWFNTDDAMAVRVAISESKSSSPQRKQAIKHAVEQLRPAVVRYTRSFFNGHPFNSTVEPAGLITTIEGPKVVDYDVVVAEENPFDLRTYMIHADQHPEFNLGSRAELALRIATQGSAWDTPDSTPSYWKFQCSGKGHYGGWSRGGLCFVFKRLQTKPSSSNSVLDLNTEFKKLMADEGEVV